MAATLVVDKLASQLKVQVIDHDPGGTTAILAAPDGGTTPVVLDMRDYSNFMVVASMKVVAAGGLTLLEIIASATSDMASAQVVATSGVIAVDALIDYAILEITSEQLHDLSTAITHPRYVCARLTCATATDEVSVVYIAKSKRPTDGLSATTIS